MIKLFTSLEEEPLNIEKLLDAKKAADKSSVYDSTYQAVKDDIVKQSEEEPEDSSSDMTESDDDNPDDTGDESDTDPKEDTEDKEESSDEESKESEEPKEEEKKESTEDKPSEEPKEKVDTSDETEEGEESKVAKEEMRNFSYPYQASLEDDSYMYNTNPGILSKTKDILYDTALYLKYLGIKYGPSILKAIYISALFVITRIIKYLYIGIKNISVFIDRRINSFQNLKNELIAIKTSIGSTEHKNDDIENQLFSNDKIIKSIVAGSSIDLIKNVETINSFVGRSVNDLSNGILKDISILKDLIGMDLAKTNCKISILHVRPGSSVLHVNSLKGYDSIVDGLTNYTSKELLPGNIKLIAYLPNDQISDIEQAKTAYSNSHMFFGIDTEEYRVYQNLHYMKPEELSNYCDVLIKLCDICLEHKSLYEKVLQSKKGLRYNFKHYFESLIVSKEKIGLRNSLIDYIYLKSMFIDKVYLSAVMDIHDYCARTIKHSITYIKSNQDKL
jgi:hypothetical protein